MQANQDRFWFNLLLINLIVWEHGTSFEQITEQSKPKPKQT